MLASKQVYLQFSVNLFGGTAFVGVTYKLKEAKEPSYHYGYERARYSLRGLTKFLNANGLGFYLLDMVKKS